MKADKIKQVEKLEIREEYLQKRISRGIAYDYSKTKIIWQKELEIVKEKAKDLKKEIEKGCEDMWEIEYDCFVECENFSLCPNCQNLIDRLNKLIGDEE